jgi:hypothetical protein
MRMRIRRKSAGSDGDLARRDINPMQLVADGGDYRSLFKWVS